MFYKYKHVKWQYEEAEHVLVHLINTVLIPERKLSKDASIHFSAI